MTENNTLLEKSLLIKTSGSSMFPFVRDSDKVIVKRLNAQELRIGDIILYKDKITGQTICHRFVKRIKINVKLTLFTRGDAGDSSCKPISEDNFIGRVVGIIRADRVLNQRTRRQIILNWVNVKFYIYFKRAMFYIFSFLQKIGLYRKLMKKVFYNKIKYLKQSDKIEAEENISSFGLVAMYKNLDIASIMIENKNQNTYPGWWINTFYVRFPFRRIGIGERLMQNVVEVAKKINIPCLFLYVDNNNLKAFNFYRKFGFKEVTRIKSEFDFGKISSQQIVMRFDTSTALKVRS